VTGGQQARGPVWRRWDEYLIRCGYSNPADYQQGRVAVVRHLLQAGADPDHQQGELLLCAAVYQQHDILHQLLEAGATQVERALPSAAGIAPVSIFTQLLRAAKGAVDEQGAAVLYAARSRRTDVLHMLLQRGANVTGALHAAVACCDAPAAALILSHRPVTQTCGRGWSTSQHRCSHLTCCGS
jgi:ankyrin repeat protein